MQHSTPKKQRAAWKKWAGANPDKVQANRNAWAQSPAGRKWLAANQKKKNEARKAWRERQRKAGRKVT
jgi:hypothetical protein